MNSEFSTKLGSKHPYQHVPEKYKAYCSIEPEKRAYSAKFEKGTSEKIAFKVFGGYNVEKNSYPSSGCANLVKTWL